MASQLAGRFIALCCTRQTSCIYIAAYRSQQTYAACAPAQSAVSESPAFTRTSVVPIFRSAANFGDRIALRDQHGDYTYRGLFLSSRQFAGELSNYLGNRRQERVAFLCPNDASYIIVQWACWMSGQIVVPMTIQHPLSLQEYYVKNSEASVVVTTPDLAEGLHPLVKNTGVKLIVLDEVLRVLAMKSNTKPSPLSPQLEPCVWDEDQPLEGGLEPAFYNDSDAMIIYTSGTTGMPKGVVITHSNIYAQINSLVQAWGWNEKDSVLHTLPLHHIHGIINVLLCPLAVGARCVMLPKFESSNVWSQLLAINMPGNERVNMFMAVPTIYMKLIEEYDRIFTKNARMQEYIKTVCTQKIRLMVSGSSPLPAPLFERWEEITGHKLLERYGMTETGMVLSNPLLGERKPGYVGTPLPGVSVKIAKPPFGSPHFKTSLNGLTISSEKAPDNEQALSGELLVKGPNVFRCYWKMPQATKKEFTLDGWFKTGDTVMCENGVYKILGRTNVDIIKTGGYKVSAVEIETHLLGHPDIVDCTVIGLPDITWGQKVAAVVVPKEGKEVILSKLCDWSKQRMAPYAVPTVLKVVDKLPKNTMGKINKKDIVRTIFPEHKMQQ